MPAVSGAAGRACVRVGVPACERARERACVQAFLHARMPARVPARVSARELSGSTNSISRKSSMPGKPCSQVAHASPGPSGIASD